VQVEIDVFPTALVTTGMQKIIIDSEELRRQRMPSPSKFHHFRKPRRDTVSFPNAVVRPSEDERFAWALDSWISDGFGQTIAIGGQAPQGWDYLP
jgi:hypothetical protein